MVVVGAGSAGCVLAARIADRYDVTLIEAGRPVMAGRADRALDAAVAHPETWALPARLTDDIAGRARPGRAVGGSSVVNGGYWLLPDAVDLEAWHDAGGDAWDPDRVRAVMRDLGDRMQAHPSPATHPVARAFADAAGGSAVAVPTTIVGGAPRTAAEAFLDDRVHVRSDCRVLRVVFADGRAVGVEVADADGELSVIDADEVVLCAGAFGTARLLLASGLGPAGMLRVDPVADLPGVGTGFSDHPTVWVEWMPRPGAPVPGGRPEDAHGAFPIALRIGADGGAGDALEILACTQPPAPEPDARTLGLIVGLQRPRSRGTVRPASAHPLAAPAIAYHYLEDEADRAALRLGVRRAAGILAAPAFAELVEELADLDPATLDDDALLDAWIALHLSSAAHTCGTAPMGAADDPLAVVDGAGWVRGVPGLRIADASVLPVVPSCGPVAAVMAVGAIVADQM